eukprot:scaffold90161_cov73-Cyclotella_meneghiniana.AAC.5
MSASKQNILGLYRRCLRSAKRINDVGQRMIYLDYLKDGFNRKVNLPPNSREAIVAYQHGVDQVTDMEYYQQMAKSKHEQGTTKNKSNTLSLIVEEVATNAAQATKIRNQSPDVEVLSWLKSQLPHLREEDAASYCKSLIEQGFDSVAFIEEELVEDDLDFMKGAHKRVLVRQLKNTRYP